ncbi:proton-conducting transporter membrane subunit, partial [Verrucomicrobiales bacterium]|nr:proton-conducting transporter membrane subunit [Verrucomicrobiales bacterium]
MEYHFFLIGLPVVLAFLVALLPGLVKRISVVFGGVLCAAFWAAAIALIPVVSAGGEHLISVSWVPELGVDLAFRTTAFSAWFAFLIFAIGGCILLYAATYFRAHDRLPFLLGCLLLFTSAMLGVVWANNFYLLFLAWEGTSLLSFLLVGFHHEKTDVREKAAQALLVTFTGGAALLAGFVCIHIGTGETTLSGLLALGSLEGPLATAAVVLIILGTLTKSAQWPFHFWLPNAMAGPTPVSAYLHSATMVKAGVFLLATLAPVLGSHPLWAKLLIPSGMLTVVVAVIRALREDDLKGVLASTTLAALGFLTILAGLATPGALLAFVIYLTAHALYKAPLFLAAGNLEKRFGTRSLAALGGAGWSAGITGIVVVVSLLSLLGVPPLPGFLGKEYLLKATWYQSPVLAVVSALAACGVIYLGFRLLFILLRRENPAPAIHAVPKPMVFATAVPAFLAVLGTALFPFANTSLLAPAATALGAGDDARYAFWYGFTPALGLGLGALFIAGIISYLTRSRSGSPTGSSLFEDLFNSIIAALRGTASGTATLLGKGALHTHLAVILAAIGSLSLATIGIDDWPGMSAPSTEHSGIFIILAPLLIASAAIAACTRKPLMVLVSLGLVGLLVAFLFLWFSAPDLALTQLLAETLVLFLLTGILARQPILPAAATGRFWRFIFAGGAGVLVTLLILKSMALEWDHPVSDYYLANSKTAAFGANVVNVILVDFRALDTLGEIVVLAIAAMGANAALGAGRRRSPLPGG